MSSELGEYRNSRTHRAVAALLVLLGIGYTLFNLYALLKAAPERRVQFVPDDAYYYMGLARNFVEHGQWSFDSGTSLTTGFHPLHAYALAGLKSLTQANGDGFVTLNVLLSYGIALPAMLLAALFALRRGGLLVSSLVLLLLISRNVSLNLTSGMEWGWTVSLAALYAAAFCGLGGQRHGKACLALGLIGLMGSLARTDFGLFPAMLFAASLTGIRHAEGKPRAAGALIGLGAAALGVAIGFLHNHWSTGQLLQSSAQMKKLWFETYGLDMKPILDKLLMLFGKANDGTRICAALLALVCLAVGWRAYWGVWIRRSSSKVDPQGAVLWFGCLAAVLGYVALYTMNPAALQHWYTANLLVPLFVVLALPLSQLQPGQVAGRVAALALLALLIAQLPRAYRFLEEPEWPHQVSALRAGQFLHDSPLPAPVGSWNAGILGFYEGGHVINLDGLVNNDIYDYAARGSLPQYVDKVGIRYLVDYEKMLSSPERRVRGGYDSEEFLERLSPSRRFDDRTEGWKELTLYTIAPSKGE
jgi:hypothetical protein